ncbi:hypothetical protein CHI95_09545 [Providencia rettgeri]|uniref:Pycsar effector protein domain-containing protein n=1 Tax=Providencia rettgeri TaxID=587 RepID=A0A264VVL3_PRORE|nr:hypothetical protein [Providencia rettgeri]ELR5253310.1 hypothetical protein [Providencia rettgeri]MDY0820732.1 hypothetical protein [Providencia rettgeri]OZS74817.1 hypothetical protein CHI95_09545 [Providencia rettgeri]
MDQNKFTSKEQIDLLQKMIVRTDGFHNYANTKSTIILTFIAAIIAAICTNINKALTYLESSDIDHVIVIFKILAFISIVLLCIALKIVLQTVIPFTEKSNTKNIYSFIDISAYYNSESNYINSFKSETEEEFINSLAALQYNLSTGLIKKYEKHKLAIEIMSYSLSLIFIDILIMFLA